MAKLLRANLFNANKHFLESFRKKLQLENQPVTEVELTSGNFDNTGKLIKDLIPTITTSFCEIGIIPESVCYFTVILSSAFFPESLFDLIKGYEGVHIYGFKNFLEDYYPKRDFSFGELVENLKKEPYFQIQFNFDTRKLDLAKIFEKYLELKKLFSVSKAVKVVNQMTRKL